MESRTAIWFETSIKYTKIGEDGQDKDVTEIYVVDALSFTEAENRITEEVSLFTRGDFDVKKISKASYKEIFFSEKDSDDRWYKAKLVFITINEKTGKEEQSSCVYLVQAASFHAALKNVDSVMSQGMQDYEIHSITETKIIDVYEYKKKSAKQDNQKPEYEETSEK
ncbi:MAG: DUF4494 domain-containing protein [Prevotellaceae bacterium]|nr:DUF4494 domain-containing protein [Prevotella sp.]MDD7256792.1 DUF4494 domain-containing protein [Prevotellaceae bacterium]MDY6131026.1 DUF4494 domain-containing protein [Prevotella sp.]